MKNYKFFGYLLLILIAISTYSCTKKIPLVHNYDKYQLSRYGAYMEVKIQGLQEKLNIKGELIFVDDKKIIIRTFEKPSTIRPFALKDLISYQLYYAKNDLEDYSFWAKVNNLSTISHGWFLIFTLPINIITSWSVNASKAAEFRLSNKELPKEKLFKFARYPVSLPFGITLNNLSDLL